MKIGKEKTVNEYPKVVSETPFTSKEPIKGSPAPMEMPEWARKIGITFPEGLAYKPDMSRITSIDNPKENFNSVHFVFKGDYELTLKQAEILAHKAAVPISPDFAEAQKIRNQNIKEAREAGHEIQIPEIKGAIYANHTPRQEVLDKLEYMISIVVEENGILTISVINRKQLEKASEGNLLR